MSVRNATVQVRAIGPQITAQLRIRDDAGYAPRFIVDEAGGSPLRCCLRRSAPGEPIALVSYAPLRRWARETGAQPGPYDEVGPVFIHAEPCDGPRTAGFPADFAGTPRIFRSYDSRGQILAGRLADSVEVADPASAAELLERIFADPAVAVAHARAVEFGCFTFEIRRWPCLTC